MCKKYYTCQKNKQRNKADTPKLSNRNFKIEMKKMKKTYFSPSNMPKDNDMQTIGQLKTSQNRTKIDISLTYALLRSLTAQLVVVPTTISSFLLHTK